MIAIFPVYIRFTIPAKVGGAISSPRSLEIVALFESIKENDELSNCPLVRFKVLIIVAFPERVTISEVPLLSVRFC